MVWPADPFTPINNCVALSFEMSRNGAWLEMTRTNSGAYKNRVRPPAVILAKYACKPGVALDAASTMLVVIRPTNDGPLAGTEICWSKVWFVLSGLKSSSRKMLTVAHSVVGCGH